MTAYNVGLVVGALIFPLIGLILLIVGIVERTRSQKQARPGVAPPPGYHPPYGPQYPQYPPYPPYPPPRPKPRGTGLIVTGAILLGLTLFGALVRVVVPDDTPADRLRELDIPTFPDVSPQGLTVGECVSDSDFRDRDPVPTDCDDPTAVMELVSRGGADARCPDGKRRDDTNYTTLFWDDETMCFAANFVEGKCYSVDTTGAREPFRLETCGGGNAQVRVDERLDGTTDESRCPTGSNPISYVEISRVYCLEPAG